MVGACLRHLPVVFPFKTNHIQVLQRIPSLLLIHGSSFIVFPSRFIGMSGQDSNLHYISSSYVFTSPLCIPKHSTTCNYSLGLRFAVFDERLPVSPPDILSRLIITYRFARTYNRSYTFGLRHSPHQTRLSAQAQYSDCT